MLTNPDGLATAAAWSLCGAWLLALGARRLARAARGAPLDGDARADAGALAALFALALAVRLALPWGPVSFAEAERLEVLWNAHPSSSHMFSAVPTLLAALRGVGVPAGSLMRWVAPLFGALGVAATWLLARGAGLDRWGAALAAAIVLAWPAHAHYSTSLTFTVEGTALWTLAFAAASDRARTLPWRAPLAAALAVLGVYSRPEYRLLLVPLAVLALGPGWSWRDRAVLAALLGLGLAPYARYLAPDNVAGSVSGDSRFFLPHFLGDVSMGPVWWLYLGALGLALGGRQRRNARAALALAVALLLASYWYLASDTNVRWSQWRYYVSVVPYAAVAAALAADALAARAPARRPAILAALVALAVLPLAAYLPTLRRAEDLQAEFAYLRESAPRVLAARGDVLMLVNRGHPGRADVGIEGNPTMALAARLGPLTWPRGCAPGRVRDLERVVDECPETVAAEGTAVYLGLSREEARLDAVRRRFRLVPIEERVVPAALTSVMSNRQCPRPSDNDIEGLWVAPCPVRLGWYRLAALAPR